jgi:sterol desaturase/sphingolipid hydroxylase (fatty acid hydroxylase superfamily)
MSSEIAIRLSFFFLIFAIIAIWELLAPRRALTSSKTSRWLSNLAITFLNPATVRLVFPILAVSMALKAQQNGWGLLNHYDLPFWPAMVVAVVVLDFATYLQHVMFHAVPLLWRLHMVHHADLDFDVTTGLRFHPIEMILSMGIKLAVVVVFGPPAMAVLTFEVILNATAMFNHGNIHLPLRIDQVLRLLIVTPDMHRVHHSVLPREANSNFGFNLPWWDRLFGTYRNQPTEGHEGMSIGLRQFREPERLTFPWLLILPFIGKTDNYPIGGRGQRP